MTPCHSQTTAATSPAHTSAGAIPSPPAGRKSRKISGASLATVMAQLDGSALAVPARDAASVILVRDSTASAPLDSTLELYLMRRQSTMAFAAGVIAFPGGSIDAGDLDPIRGWAGPSIEEWAATFGTDVELAAGIIAAAVRETFEESGVLLAGNAAGDVLADVSSPEWEEDRRRLAAHEISLAGLFVERNLVLRSDLLRYWSSWTTPVFEPRRYRTFFFAAGVPDGQSTRDVSTESSLVYWSRVSDVLKSVDNGELRMMSPQYSTCLEMLEYVTVEQVRATDRQPHSVELSVHLDAGDGWLHLPQRLAGLVDDWVRSSRAIERR